MNERILVADDDEDISLVVEANLRAAGYEVLVARDGTEAIMLADAEHPDLIVLDIAMPRIDGIDVARWIRKNPRTADVSIIMLTAATRSSDKVLGLSAGADDYITKPFDPIELLARVGVTLRRAKALRDLSALTGLPGNTRIEQEVERHIRERRPFAALYVDLDHFKAFNDRYGWGRGDELIMTTARIVQDEVTERAGAAAFTGHVGGDDLVVVVAPEHAEAVAEAIIRRFDDEKDGFYDLTDLERGYLETPDRQGVPQRYPLAAVSIGIATSAIRPFEHYAEVVAVAAEMKRLAKRDPWSSFAIDRRGARASRPADTLLPG